MKKMFPTFEEYLRDKWKNNHGPYLATDILIEYYDKEKNKEGIVLIGRKYYPYGLAIPGGIAERITLPMNAIKEAREETGLKVIIQKPTEVPFSLLSNVDQDPRAFIVSACYLARGYGKLRPDPKEDAKTARVYDLAELEKLVTDKKVWAFQHHRKIIGRYLEYKRGQHGN